MQTNFPDDALLNPDMAESNKILRKCVHCGMCNATCPTYQLLGDELDGPRGRIYLMKDMLEQNRPASALEVKHIDRCLTCLSCMTTCPGGVHYGHLVDHARAHIEQTYARPIGDRLIRNILALILPYRGRFYWALRVAGVSKIAIPVLEKLPFTLTKRMAAMLKLAPAKAHKPYSIAAQQNYAKRVILLQGCAQPVLKPEINNATIELLNRFGVEVAYARGEGCCGALVHHMGKTDIAHAQAINNINAWTAEIEARGADAIIITASGCGTSIKDYGHMFRNDPQYAEKAARISSLAKDVTEFLVTLNAPAPKIKRRITVAYHSACSMQHGQKITTLPKQLLEQAGYIVKDVPEGHLCCGSAGVYNIMQSEIAQQLLARKVGNIESTQPEIIATGNIGCITQIATGTKIPIAHTIELLNWAYGGASPLK